MSDGVVPRSLVTSSHHFHRQAYGIVPPNGVRIHVAGVDLIRDGAGDFRVLEDNLRNPSGVSYVLENRRTLAHVLPEVFAGHLVQPVSGRASAPSVPGRGRQRSRSCPLRAQRADSSSHFLISGMGCSRVWISLRRR